MELMTKSEQTTAASEMHAPIGTPYVIIGWRCAKAQEGGQPE